MQSTVFIHFSHYVWCIITLIEEPIKIHCKVLLFILDNPISFLKYVDLPRGQVRTTPNRFSVTRRGKGSVKRKPLMPGRAYLENTLLSADQATVALVRKLCEAGFKP